MSIVLGPFQHLVLTDARLSRMPESDLDLIAPVGIEAFPLEGSAQMGPPDAPAGVPLWRDCSIGTAHGWESDGCACGLPAWAGEDAALADCAARAIAPTALASIEVIGAIAVHSHGLRAETASVTALRLTPWCAPCQAAGFWEIGWPTLDAAGPVGGMVRILCEAHAGGRAPLDPEHLSDWLGVTVLAGSGALGRVIRRHMPGPADPPGQPVPPLVGRTIAGLRMGQRGFVAIADVALTATGGLEVRDGAAAPQCPVTPDHAIAVRRGVDLRLEAFCDRAALDAVLARGITALQGPTSPLRLPVPVADAVARRPRPSERRVA